MALQLKKSKSIEMVNLKGKKKMISYIKVKRVIDFILALILLILAFIPMIIIGLAIKIEDGEPIIYKSKRIGKDLKEFYIYKFRSMKTGRKELESNLSHDEMLTKVGKFIRKTSLDELPQLINILKGEMSFIGPRPWIPEYYEWFTTNQKRRTEVLPGMSGLAQVKGRNGISIFEKINYDLEYVEKISFKEDVKLVFETFKAVFSKKDAEITESGIKSEINNLKEQEKEEKVVNR